MCHANGIGQLDLAFFCYLRRHDILGNIAGRISCGTVYLRAILAGECPASMAGHSAIGVYDDLTSCKAAVAMRPADHKAACGIDEELRLPVNHPSWNNRFENMLLNVLMNLLLTDIRVMLG